MCIMCRPFGGAPAFHRRIVWRLSPRPARRLRPRQADHLGVPYTPMASGGVVAEIVTQLSVPIFRLRVLPMLQPEALRGSSSVLLALPIQ